MNSCKMGSTLSDTVEAEPSLEVRKFDRHAMMQTVVSDLMDLKVSAKASKRPQVLI